LLAFNAGAIPHTEAALTTTRIGHLAASGALIHEVREENVVESHNVDRTPFRGRLVGKRNDTGLQRSVISVLTSERSRVTPNEASPHESTP